MYYTYMLRCEDDSIYTGITNDIERRMKEHFYEDKKKAKYTRSHKAKKLEAVWKSEDKILASKLEYHIKKLTKVQKEQLIQERKLNEKLLIKVDCSKYIYVNDFK